MQYAIFLYTFGCVAVGVFLGYVWGEHRGFTRRMKSEMDRVLNMQIDNQKMKNPHAHATKIPLEAV